jgi:hypothetical protein
MEVNKDLVAASATPLVLAIPPERQAVDAALRNVWSLKAVPAGVKPLIQDR